MNRIDFDHYSDNYNEVLAKSIGFAADSDFFDHFKINRIGEYFSVGSQFTILDFGCGIGKLSALLAKKFPDSEINGFDVSEKSIALARKNNADLRNLFFSNDLNPNRKYDIILASNVFHHIKNTERFSTLQKLKNLLKPKSTIIIFEHNPFNPFTRYIVNRCPFDADAELISRRTFIQSALACELNIKLSHYVLIFPWNHTVYRKMENLFKKVCLGSQYMLFLKNDS